MKFERIHVEQTGTWNLLNWRFCCKTNKQYHSVNSNGIVNEISFESIPKMLYEVFRAHSVFYNMNPLKSWLSSTQEHDRMCIVKNKFTRIFRSVLWFRLSSRYISRNISVIASFHSIHCMKMMWLTFNIREYYVKRKHDEKRQFFLCGEEKFVKLKNVNGCDAWPWKNVYIIFFPLLGWKILKWLHSDYAVWWKMAGNHFASKMKTCMDLYTSTQSFNANVKMDMIKKNEDIWGLLLRFSFSRSLHND